MLYLVQHAEAKDSVEDPERDLSSLGSQHAEALGAFMAAHGVRPVEIWHSGKLRSEHTARIAAEAIGRGDVVLLHDHLQPNDDPLDIRRELDELEARDLMIVGHLPYLQRLVGSLVASPDSAPPVRFRNAGIVALSRDESGWTVEWAVPPGLF